MLFTLNSINILKSCGCVSDVHFLKIGSTLLRVLTLAAKVIVVEFVIFQWHDSVRYTHVSSPPPSQYGFPPSEGSKYLSGWSYKETNDAPNHNPSSMILGDSGLCK